MTLLLLSAIHVCNIILNIFISREVLWNFCLLHKTDRLIFRYSLYKKDKFWWSEQIQLMNLLLYLESELPTDVYWRKTSYLILNCITHFQACESVFNCLCSFVLLNNRRKSISSFMIASRNAFPMLYILLDLALWYCSWLHNIPIWLMMWSKKFYPKIEILVQNTENPCKLLVQWNDFYHFVISWSIVLDSSCIQKQC